MPMYGINHISNHYFDFELLYAIYYYVHMRSCPCVCMRALGCMWEAKGNFQGSVVSFHTGFLEWQKLLSTKPSCQPLIVPLIVLFFALF